MSVYEREKMTAPSPQLHSKDEIDRLSACARSVPERGVIVEIGTGLGGSTLLLRDSAPRSATLYSLDVNQVHLPDRERLREAGVRLLSGTTAAATAAWDQPVDFLFVDGGHRLVDALADFTGWAKHLKPDAIVAFHDYDEPIAGGIYYLGVRVVVDTLMRLGMLSDVRQYTTLLIARVNASSIAKDVRADDLLETLRRYAERVVKARDYFLPVINAWMDTDGMEIGAAVMAAPAVFKCLDGAPYHPMCDRLNIMALCYVFDYFFKRDVFAERFLGQSPGLYKEMMLWLDAERRVDYPSICAFGDICDPVHFPDALHPYRLETVDEISRFVTLEQVRLNMLSRIVIPVFDEIVRSC